MVGGISVVATHTGFVSVAPIPPERKNERRERLWTGQRVIHAVDEGARVLGALLDDGAPARDAVIVRVILGRVTQHDRVTPAGPRTTACCEATVL